MIVRPVIGGWEVPRIERIESRERRRLARLPVPGLLGDLQQDLGAESLAAEISGSLQGDEARDDFLNSVREKFRAGEPVSFVADITTATELDQVLIEELEVEEVNEAAGSFRYRIVLREYVEPPEPPAPIDDLGLDLGLELDDLAALGLDGLKLPDILGDIPALGDPVAPLQPALEGVSAATSQIPSLLDGLKAKFL
ncbi:MAG TPA: hypothetical protein VGQ15_06680 [Gaiellaceae bacterium]|jgi:hypothetical protein|nr:hypothetical protein [Gaiellaceae bacterium]